MPYNFILALYHIELTQNGCMLFYKCLPKFEDSYPLIAWTSLVCIFLHCFAIPTEWKPRNLFQARQKWARKMITATYILCSASILYIAYSFRQKSSGRNFKKQYFIISAAANFPFGVFHLEIVKNRCVTFLGCFPDIHFEYPTLSWAALVFAFLHCFAFPVEWEPNRWIRKGRKWLPIYLWLAQHSAYFSATTLNIDFLGKTTKPRQPPQSYSPTPSWHFLI